MANCLKKETDHQEMGDREVQERCIIARLDKLKSGEAAGFLSSF